MREDDDDIYYIKSVSTTHVHQLIPIDEERVEEVDDLHRDVDREWNEVVKQDHEDDEVGDETSDWAGKNRRRLVQVQVPLIIKIIAH